MRFGPYSIELTNTDKVLFPGSHLTKQHLIDYYNDVAGIMLPHIRNRPLTLRRFPDGLDGEGFYQQRREDYFPEWLQSVTAPTADDDASIEHILCNNRASLVWLTNQAAITLHCWLSKSPALTRPDRLVFDLDPPGEDFPPVKRVAKQVVAIMQETGLRPHVMTTGSRGLHVAAPLKPAAGFDTVRQLAKDMAAWLAAEDPGELTVEQRKDKRGDRVYLDISRNAYGQTAVAPYSVRCRPGAPVASPLSLEELDDPDMTSQRYHIGNIMRRLGQKGDPWKNINRLRVGFDSARKKLDQLMD